MSITDELREWMGTVAWLDDNVSHTRRDLTVIADRIDAEHERELRETGEDIVRDVKHEWVRLPLDADGVPIHIGDVLDGYGKTIEVVEMRYGRSGWVLISRDGNGYADTFAFTHHAPTVEDVLREFGKGWYEQMNGPETFDIADYVEQYAAKLRLAKEDA